MNERRRNMAVGLFVIIGFILLAAIILLFSDLASWAREGYEVTVRMPDSSGIVAGKEVFYRGIRVGSVTDVSLASDSGAVVIKLKLDKEFDIPKNVQLTTQQTGFGDTEAHLAISPGEMPAEEDLAKDGSAEIGGYESAGGLIPQPLIEKFTEAMEKFNRLQDQLIVLTELRSPEDVAAGAEPNLSTLVQRTDQALAAFASEENVQNVRETLAHAAEVTEKLSTTLEKADKLVGSADYQVQRIGSDFSEIKNETVQLVNRLELDAIKLGTLLDTANSLAKGIQEGEGTAGKLLTDDELHEYLSVLILEMQETFKDAQRLITKLEKEGLF